MTSTVDAPSRPPAAARAPGLPRLRRRVPARRPARLLRVFRPARGRPTTRPRSARVTRAADRGRARRTSGGTPPCCPPARTRPPGSPSTRADPAGPRRRAGRRSRAARPAVGQGRLGQPDPLVQGPGRLGRADRRPRRSASPGSPAPPPATWPTRWPPTPPGPASRRWCSSRPTWSPARSSPPRSTAATLVAIEGSYDDVNRLCSRAGRDRRVRGHRVRQRQPPAVLRRGLQDARVRGGRAARLAASRPRWSSRWPAASC